MLNGDKKSCEKKIRAIYRSRWADGDSEELRERALDLADFLVEEGLLTEACKIYKRLLSIDPKDQESRDLMEDIKVELQ